MDTFTPYNLSLPSSSPTFIYQPFRDRWCGLQGDPAGGWRSSYPDVATWANGGLNNAGIGVPFRETYLDGANVTLQFEGTAIYLCLTPTGVSFDFLVDGNQVSTSGPAMDPACAETGAELMAYTDGLTYGSHTATMRVNSQGNTDFLFFGGIITIGLNGTDPTPRLVDDTVVGWSYEPSSAWAHSADSGTSDHTSLSYTCSYGPSYTASYSFNGSSAVQLLGLLEVNIDPYTIVLDGQSYQFNGSDLWRQSQQVLFFKGGLDASKQYTITLINYDQSAPDAQQPIGPDFYPCASVQALLLTQVTAIPPSISTARPAASGSLPIEAIIGGAVGGLAALCIIGYLLWFFCWNRRSAPRSLFEIDPDPIGIEHAVIPYILPSVQTRARFPLRSQEAGILIVQSPETNHATYSPVSYQSSRSDGKRRPGDVPICVEQASRTRTSFPAPAVVNSSPLQSSRNASSDLVNMNRASTQDLVGILNRRLPVQYRADSDSDLPEYESVV